MVELLLIWLMLGCFPAVVAARRGLPVLTWFLYGVLIMPVAMVHVFFAKPDSVTIAIRPETQRKCPACAEPVRPEAKICKHCGRDLPPRPTETPPPRRVTMPSAGVGVVPTVLILIVVAGVAGVVAWYWLP
jgi:hypothetical protein